VVDDNRDVAVSLAMLLCLEGHEVETAHDGEAALARAEAVRPEMILLDIGLPQVNGYEVARKVRSEDWGRKITLVALTGWGNKEDRERSQDAGFDHHLVKPVDPWNRF
jgi:CheY-like chemotaxis protein